MNRSPPPIVEMIRKRNDADAGDRGADPPNSATTIKDFE
jgi:hypothetical protein